MVMGVRFHRFHPLTAFLYYVGAICLLIVMLHPIYLIIGFSIIMLINLVHDGLTGLKRWKIFLITTFLFMLLLNPLFNERGRYLLLEIGQHRITVEALLYGGMNALSIISIIALFVSYNVIMTPNKLLFLFARVLPQFAVLLMLTLRFIPLMRRRVEEISAVQRSKGISVLQGNGKTKLKTGMLYIQVLLTFSLEEAIQTADSMKARGYGQGPRATYEYFKFQKADFFAVSYLLILFAITLTGRYFGYGFLTIYPVMEHLSFSFWDSGILVCYLMYLCFPLFVEVGEMVQWRLSN